MPEEDLVAVSDKMDCQTAAQFYVSMHSSSRYTVQSTHMTTTTDMDVSAISRLFEVMHMCGDHIWQANI